MAKTITIDGVEITQIVLMKDSTSGKVLVQATYRVKAGADVVKTVSYRGLVSAGTMSQGPQPVDAMSSVEQTAASAIWDAVTAAVQRLEL